MSAVYEYDGYVLPKTLDKETPETRAILAQKLENIKELSKRLHKEAEEREKNKTQ